jgi:Fe2+ transport system protein FeoA
MNRIIKEAWALSAEAKEGVKRLTEMGIDPDLAIAILEQFWGVDEVYDLGDDE